MRSTVLTVLNRNPDYWEFMRQYPFWHRLLSRHPEYINKFVEDYKIIRRKRWVDKIEDTADMIQLMKSLMEEM